MLARLGSTVAPRSIVAAVEFVYVRVTEVREIDALLGEPSIESCCAPGLGAHANNGVTLIDQ